MLFWGNTGKAIFGALILCLLYGCDVEGSKTHNRDRRLTGAELQNVVITEPATGPVYCFGFDLRSSPREDARQYRPLLDYLQRKTGYTFKLRFTPKDSSIIQDLDSNIVQFAALGAVSYIKARKHHKIKPLVRGLNIMGKDKYRSVFVVPTSSSISRLDDIKGKRFAFGNRFSTQGHLIARIVFYKHQIKLSDLKSYQFTGSHINCLNSVLLHVSDICAMQDVMAENAARQDKVKIIYRSDWYPSSGIMANQQVPSTVVRRVKAALLDFRPNDRDAKGLYRWDKTEMAKGFVEARDQDYAYLRGWINKLALEEFN